MRVNIGPGNVVEMTAEETAAYNWGRGKLPERFGVAPKLLANGTPVRNATDAYWFAQPAEVQALRTMTEPALSALAHELADKGFLIDVPIMVWGWDPVATMQTRHSQGFTWVPSGNMQPVSVGPGLSFPGLPSYDADNPPKGSIKVTTEWARGFELTAPWQWGIPFEIF